jgi:hypothetical protein
MRWLALVAAALVASAALLLLLVSPPVSTLPAAGVHVDLEAPPTPTETVQLVRSDGQKGR